jgi:TIR domain
MSRCTAPVEGHRSASAAARCPACRGRRSYGRSSYSAPTYTRRSYPAPVYQPRASIGSGGSSGSRVRPKWSPSNSSVTYTPQQVQALAPVRQQIEVRAQAYPDLRDAFLCHAWDDRRGVAKDLHDLLEAKGVSVWFSEKDILPGVPFLRAIDKGLANSRIGLVMVTPSLMTRIQAEGIADKELSALLEGNLLVPVVHDTTYGDVRAVSPLLASRHGFDTGEDSLEVIAVKIAELVDLTRPVGA